MHAEALCFVTSLETKVPLRPNEVSEFLLSETEGGMRMEVL